jgi:hypothetical protein
VTERAAGAVAVLDAFRQEAGLSRPELWLRYFELGGMSSGSELEAFLDGQQTPTDHDRDLIAHALNERFAELGGDQAVTYRANVSGRAWFASEDTGGLRRRVGQFKGHGRS